MVKGKSYSLREFIEQAPGAPPVESLLPHKSGERVRDTVEGGVSRLALGKDAPYDRYGRYGDRNSQHGIGPRMEYQSSHTLRDGNPLTYSLDLLGPQRRGEYPMNPRDRFDPVLERGYSRESEYGSYGNGQSYGRRSRGDDWSPYDRPGSRNRQDFDQGQSLSRQSSGAYMRPGSSYGIHENVYGRPDSRMSSDYYPPRPSSQRSDEYHFGRPPSSYSEYYAANASRVGDYPIPRPDSARSSEGSFAPRAAQRPGMNRNDHDTYLASGSSPGAPSVRSESRNSQMRYSSRSSDRYDTKMESKHDSSQASSTDTWKEESRMDGTATRPLHQGPHSSQSHNSFAEEAAKQGAERLASAKSCLVGSSTSAEHVLGSDKPADNEVVVKPSQPGQRPRLNLKPKTQLDPLPNAENDQPTSRAELLQRPKLTLEPRTAPLDAPQVKAEEKRRPKLNLKPRSKPVEDGLRDAPKQASVFGKARPREEVLKERGVDPLDELTTEKPRAVTSVAKNTSSNWANPHTKDEWHTVTLRKHSRKTSIDLLDASGLGADPFFSEAYPRPIALSPTIGGLHGYGSDHLFGMSSGLGGYGQDEQEQDSIFPGRRALPTRTDDLY